MTACDRLAPRLREVAALRPEEVPAGDREHLRTCPTCARALAGTRLARGLVAAAGAAPEPPTGFVERILAAVPLGPARQGAGPEVWRAAWGLVPAFAAAAVTLLVLFQASASPILGGLVPTAGLGAGERLVLEALPPDPDLVLAAVLEGPGR